MFAVTKRRDIVGEVRIDEDAAGLPIHVDVRALALSSRIDPRVDCLDVGAKEPPRAIAIVTAVAEAEDVQRLARL